MRILLGLAVVAAGCGVCESVERVEECSACPRGDVRRGAIVRAEADDDSYAVRPGGGWARICGRSVAWFDQDFAVERVVDVGVDGWTHVRAVGPDDAVYIGGLTSDDFDNYLELVAVGRDGRVRWRRDLGVVTSTRLEVTTTADAVYLS